MSAKVLFAMSMLLISFFNTASLIDVSFSGQINTLRQASCTELDTSGTSPRCRAWDFELLASSTFYNDASVVLGDDFLGAAVIDPHSDFSISSDGYQAVYSDATLDTEITVGGIIFPNDEEPDAMLASVKRV